MEPAPLSTAVDAAELQELHARWGAFPVETHALQVAHPFLSGDHQLLTANGRRAEICYVLHEGDPQAGLLFQAKSYYPAGIFRLPTGGVHVGEGVEETLAREVEEETGLRVGAAGAQSVQVERLLGVLVYAMEHSTLGAQPFATYAWLVRKQPGAPLAPQDDGESISGWQWTPAVALAQKAALLAAVGGRSDGAAAPWADWGRFRALIHTFVADRLRPAG